MNESIEIKDQSDDSGTEIIVFREEAEKPPTLERELSAFKSQEQSQL